MAPKRKRHSCRPFTYPTPQRKQLRCFLCGEEKPTCRFFFGRTFAKRKSYIITFRNSYSIISVAPRAFSLGIRTGTSLFFTTVFTA